MKKRTLIIAVSFLFALRWPGFVCGQDRPASQRLPPLSAIADAVNNGRFRQALSLCRLGAASQDLRASLNQAIILKDLGYLRQAIAVLERSRQQAENDVTLALLLARLHYLNSQPDQAIAILEKLLARDKDNQEALITLGLCYQDKRDDRRAQEYYARAVSVNKDNILAHLSLADLYYRSNRLVESEREFKTVSILDASIHQIYQYWGQVLFRLNNLKEAFRVYSKLSQLEPENRFVRDRLDEIKLALGKDYFEKERAERAAEKVRRSVLVKPFVSSRSIPTIRVGLRTVSEPVELRSSTDFSIRTQERAFLIARGKAEKNYRIVLRPDKKAVISDEDNENVVIEEPFIIKPVRPEGAIMFFDMPFGQNNFWAGSQDRAYRGEIEFSFAGSGLRIVNRIGLEEYLMGVVPSEMPSNWPVEALKAQVVAARSESLCKLGRHKQDGYDLCPEVHCQVYSGVKAEDERVNRLVDATQGIVLEYQSKPVDALYSSNCGGHSQANIFGSGQEVAYLKARPDTLVKLPEPFPLPPDALEYWLKQPPPGVLCDNPQYTKASNFRWTRIYSAAEVDRMVAGVKNIGEVKNIVVTRRNVSGHIHALLVRGSAGTCVIEKEFTIRKVFGNLRSSMFKVETKYGADGKAQSFIFYGGGWGHGVGMCQAGACGMALQGKDYRQILGHYFSQASIRKKY